MNNKFESLNVTHSNDLATFVPKPFFNETAISDYLQYNLKVLKNDFIAFDTIENAEIVNVYIPFMHLNNFLFDRFGNFEYKHSATVLVEKLTQETFMYDQTRVFVNVEKDLFQVLVFKHKKMVFSNTFSFKTKEDFIYYILFVAEQLYLNTEKFQLTFLSDIDKKTELYEIAYKYINNIDFFQPNYIIPKEFNLSNHSYFTLLNQY